MADVIYDENGNPVEETGEKKKPLYADHMNKGDVKDMMLELREFSQEASQQVYNTEIGVGYKDTETALSNFLNCLNGGRHMEFYRENSWMANNSERNKFLDEKDAEQSRSDKEALVDFYNLLRDTKGYQAEVTKFINSFIADTLWRAYFVRRFHLKMFRQYTGEDFYKIRNAFAEFDKIYRMYNDASIYRSLDIHKSENTPEEMYEMVLDHMDDTLVNSKQIGEFIINTTQASASYMNKLYLLDRDTKEFDKFASKESHFRSDLEDAEKLMQKAEMISGQYAELSSRFLTGYVEVLNRIRALLKCTLETIDDYKTKKTDAPYEVMHYPMIVKEVVAQYHLGSVENTIVYGTSYTQFARGMIAVFKNLAKSVVKCAPQ